MSDGIKTIDSNAVEGIDLNGDGHISKEEMDMHLEFKRKALEDKVNADKYFEEFTKKYKGIGKEKTMNLTLKRID